MTTAYRVISDTTPAAASTAAGSTLKGLGGYDALQITADLLAAAAAIRYMVNCPNAGATGITVVGKNLTPALAANTVVGGAWGDRIRALYTAGVSTSAGAAINIHVVGYTSRK